MRVFDETNVNWMLPHVVHAVQVDGVKADSRNGPTLEFNEPVTSCYQSPRERVLFCPDRDANPFFHFFESLWMLAGRNDLQFPATFSKNIAAYSDDGETLNGSAYGKRWKDYFPLQNRPLSNARIGKCDQIEQVIEMLIKNPMDRRVVLQMWDAEYDLNSPSKDVPCNMLVVFRVRPDRNAMRNEDGDLPHNCLTMTVYNRSNDIIYGAYGANAVHFSVLLEYMAGRVGLPVGEYWQVSNSLHAYIDTEVWKRVKDVSFTTLTDHYETGTVEPYPMFDAEEDARLWDRDLQLFFQDPFSNGYTHSFFRKVVKPLYAAHMAYKRKDREAAYEALAQMPVKNDWKLAAEEWLQRRWRNKDVA